jgi:hypothetical protein
MTVHRGEDSVHDPRRDGIRHHREHVAHGRRLVGPEVTEDDVAQEVAGNWLGAADADAQSRVLLGAERRLHAAQAVVPARRALGAKTEGAEREGDVINNNEQVVGDGPEWTLRVRRERIAAQVHERVRLKKANAASLQLAVRGARVGDAAPRGETPNVGQVVDDPPADVVTRGLVFGTRIAEADDEFHGGDLA